MLMRRHVATVMAGCGPSSLRRRLLLLLLSHAAQALQPLALATNPGSCLGKRALLITGHEAHRSLEVADALLREGASVELLVPLPQAGSASKSEGALRLMQRIQRQGFRMLMENLEYIACDPRKSVGTGNRPRVTWSHVRADDIEALALALSDSDLVLLDGASAASPLSDTSEESARQGGDARARRDGTVRALGVAVAGHRFARAAGVRSTGRTSGERAESRERGRRGREVRASETAVSAETRLVSRARDRTLCELRRDLREQRHTTYPRQRRV
eukprot:6493103-Prymnesium_polylepis.1